MIDQNYRAVNARVSSNEADPTCPKGQPTPTQTRPTRANLLSGANVKLKRGKKNQQPKAYVLDIGKAISLELTAIEYGFDVIDAGLEVSNE
ncbi:hypothetical protein BH10CHL1_BH10CHL1_47800 [soil metagenome]